MVKAAYLFSGQGQQFQNMGVDLYQNEPAYRELVDEASRILDQDFSNPDIMDAEENVQLSIVIFSLGIERILKQEPINPQNFLGLSLGEYSALMAAKSFSLKDGLEVISDRARYMAEAGKANPGKMVAVLNASEDVIENALVEARKAGDVFPANYNTPNQTVFGGNENGITTFSNVLKSAGVKRVVPIKMPVASHTPYMQPAKVQLQKRLVDVKVQAPQVSVISNTTKTSFEVESLKDTLANQLTHPTYFTDGLRLIEESPIDCLIEIGPGKALSGFAKKTLKNQDLPIFNVFNVENLNKLRTYLADQEAH